jgi:hypothetical protein
VSVGFAGCVVACSGAYAGSLPEVHEPVHVHAVQWKAPPQDRSSADARLGAKEVMWKCQIHSDDHGLLSSQVLAEVSL